MEGWRRGDPIWCKVDMTWKCLFQASYQYLDLIGGYPDECLYGEFGGWDKVPEDGTEMSHKASIERFEIYKHPEAHLFKPFENGSYPKKPYQWPKGNMPEMFPCVSNENKHICMWTTGVKNILVTVEYYYKDVLVGQQRTSKPNRWKDGVKAFRDYYDEDFFLWQIGISKDDVRRSTN